MGRIRKVDSKKKKVAIIFGGMSSEHDVSCVSAATVAEAIDKDKYELIYIGITKEGHWLLVEDPSKVADKRWETEDRDKLRRAIISPDTDHTLLITDSEGNLKSVEIDVAYPVLHGLFGEDGTIQGLFEMAHIPYVGCGHLSSAITMDKFFTKIIADSIGVNQADFVGVRDYETEDRYIEQTVQKIENVRKKIAVDESLLTYLFQRQL